MLPRSNCAKSAPARGTIQATPNTPADMGSEIRTPTCRHITGLPSARGPWQNSAGRDTSALGPDAGRHDDPDALPSVRSGNVVDGPIPP